MKQPPEPIYHVIKLYPERWIVAEYFTKAVVADGSPAACEAAVRLMNMRTAERVYR